MLGHRFPIPPRLTNSDARHHLPAVRAPVSYALEGLGTLSDGPRRGSNCFQKGEETVGEHINVGLLKIISGWWYTYPSEKYEFVTWDDDSQYMEK